MLSYQRTVKNPFRAEIKAVDKCDWNIYHKKMMTIALLLFFFLKVMKSKLDIASMLYVHTSRRFIWKCM